MYAVHGACFDRRLPSIVDPTYGEYNHPHDAYTQETTSRLRPPSQEITFTRPSLQEISLTIDTTYKRPALQLEVQLQETVLTMDHPYKR